MEFICDGMYWFRVSLFKSTGGLKVRAGGVSVMETVIRCDTERTALLEEEARLMKAMNAEVEPAPQVSQKASGKHAAPQPTAAPSKPDPDATARLEQVDLPVDNTTVYALTATCLQLHYSPLSVWGRLGVFQIRF